MYVWKCVGGWGWGWAIPLHTFLVDVPLFLALAMLEVCIQCRKVFTAHGSDRGGLK
jgi:hypothetical protein